MDDVSVNICVFLYTYIYICVCEATLVYSMPMVPFYSMWMLHLYGNELQIFRVTHVLLAVNVFNCIYVCCIFTGMCLFVAHTHSYMSRYACRLLDSLLTSMWCSGMVVVLEDVMPMV